MIIHGQFYDGIVGKPDLDEALEHYGVKGMKWRRHLANAKNKINLLKTKAKRKLKGYKANEVTLNINKNQGYWQTDDGRTRSTSNNLGNDSRDTNKGYSKEARERSGANMTVRDKSYSNYVLGSDGKYRYKKKLYKNIKGSSRN